MSVLPYVVHAGARPISVAEFADAIRATCPPRFPKARGLRPRPVGLAVSGGVDSMALAYLCSQLRREYPTIRISDNPVLTFHGMVVDHGLRAGSSEEARAVVGALQAMRIRSSVWTLNWGPELPGDGGGDGGGDGSDSGYGYGYGHGHPKDLPNLESAGRRLRYRELGLACARLKMASLLLAHQEDDQYETILMRLLQGHGSRGLRGMKRASDIPECEGIHGAYQSGYVDDQKRHPPYYSYNMPKRELRSLEQELRSSSSRQMSTQELHEIKAREAESESIAGSGDHGYGLEESGRPNSVQSPGGENIEVEDGGVTVYRPFLEFSKDRLVATCLENKVSWWEDQTNHDASLTLRNAVRHLYKGHDLPKALQKPAILDLSRRCDGRARAQEAAAQRLLSRAVIHEFAPNAGTAVVQFPHIEPSASKRVTRSPRRRQARLSQQREIAGVLIQKMLALVSPEPQTPPLANLQNVIPRLFPSLASPSDAAALASPAKAFTIAGVHLVPVEPNNNPRLEEPSATAAAPRRQPLISWYLSRTPYPSNLPLPRSRSPFLPMSRNESGGIQPSPWPKWLKWNLWDNRFWIRLTHRLPCRVSVQPFAKEHVKPLREGLPPHDRARLAALLKRHAPGKVRYTLPAIYLERDLDLADPYANMIPKSNPDPSGAPDISDMKLLALPTLGVRIPKLGQWLDYEVRYRKVDRGTLGTAGTFPRGSFKVPSAAAAKAKAATSAAPRQMGYGTERRGRASVWWRGRQTRLRAQ